MDLSFSKKGDWYEATFTAEGAFNLHIEKPNGPIEMGQSSVEGGEYAPVEGLNLGYDNTVIDRGFSGVVYPVYIKVRSKVMPTKAVVNF